MDLMHGQAFYETITVLDTGRFRSLLDRRYGVDPRSIHAYILGEHGDTDVPAWSMTNIGAVPLVDNTVLGKSFQAEEMNHLFEQVRDAAYEIIDRKGYTNSAIGIAIVRLVKAVFEDQRSVLPTLNDTELDALRHSAQTLRESIKGISI